MEQTLARKCVDIKKKKYFDDRQNVPENINKHKLFDITTNLFSSTEPKKKHKRKVKQIIEQEKSTLNEDSETDFSSIADRTDIVQQTNENYGHRKRKKKKHKVDEANIKENSTESINKPKMPESFARLAYSEESVQRCGRKTESITDRVSNTLNEDRGKDFSLISYQKDVVEHISAKNYIHNKKKRNSCMNENNNINQNISKSANEGKIFGTTNYLASTPNKKDRKNVENGIYTVNEDNEKNRFASEMHAVEPTLNKKKKININQNALEIANEPMMKQNIPETLNEKNIFENITENLTCLKKHRKKRKEKAENLPVEQEKEILNETHKNHDSINFDELDVIAKRSAKKLFLHYKKKKKYADLKNNNQNISQVVNKGNEISTNPNYSDKKNKHLQKLTNSLKKKTNISYDDKEENISIVPDKIDKEQILTENVFHRKRENTLMDIFSDPSFRKIFKKHKRHQKIHDNKYIESAMIDDTVEQISAEKDVHRRKKKKKDAQKINGYNVSENVSEIISSDDTKKILSTISAQVNTVEQISTENDVRIKKKRKKDKHEINSVSGNTNEVDSIDLSSDLTIKKHKTKHHWNIENRDLMIMNMKKNIAPVSNKIDVVSQTVTENNVHMKKKESDVSKSKNVFNIQETVNEDDKHEVLFTSTGKSKKSNHEEVNEIALNTVLLNSDAKSGFSSPNKMIMVSEKNTGHRKKKNKKNNVEMKYNCNLYAPENEKDCNQTLEDDVSQKRESLKNNLQTHICTAGEGMETALDKMFSPRKKKKRDIVENIQQNISDAVTDISKKVKHKKEENVVMQIYKLNNAIESGIYTNTDEVVMILQTLPKDTVHEAAETNILDNLNDNAHSDIPLNEVTTHLTEMSKTLDVSNIVGRQIISLETPSGETFTASQSTNKKCVNSNKKSVHMIKSSLNNKVMLANNSSNNIDRQNISLQTRDKKAFDANQKINKKHTNSEQESDDMADSSFDNPGVLANKNLVLQNKNKSHILYQRERETKNSMDEHEKSDECPDSDLFSASENELNFSENEEDVRDTLLLDTTEEVVEFEIPPLHDFETVCVLNEKQRKKLASDGVEIKKDKWTKMEDLLLRKNFEEFIERFHIKDPVSLLGIGLRTKHKNMKNFIKAKHFYVRLGKGLDNRTLTSIYRRARLIFDPLKTVAKCNETEINKIVQQQSVLGNKWTKIRKKVNRESENCRAVSRWHGVDVNKGCWTPEEQEKLAKAIVKVSGIYDLSSEKIRSISWIKVGGLVKTRNYFQCRDYWYRHYFEPSLGDRRWKKQHTRQLINILKNSWTVKHEHMIDWEKVHKEFENVAPSVYFIKRKWSYLKSRIPNNRSLNCKDIIKRLCIKYLSK